MTNFIEYLQAHLKMVVAVCFVLLAGIAGSTLMIDSSHAHTWAEKHVPFFWSFFGFSAAAVIIGITRWLGRSGIQASPDVYTCSTSTACEEE
jgi:S-adenosylmethionine/arginine decarboxylase-like enzyme